MEKTCGNCGHGCYESTVYCEVNNCDMLVNCEACDDWIEPTSQHRRCDKITQLEQRYQQLAAAARNLYKDLERVTDKRLERSKRENMLETHFNKLYDLGVEL